MIVVANKPKKTIARDRRAKLDQLRHEQKAAERRKTIIFVTIAAVAAVGILAAAIIPLINESREESRPYTDFGVPAAAAGCDPVADDPIASSTHVSAGTRITYTTVPPSSGDHWEVPAPFGRAFYTAADAPPIEQLVHNLEHGYTIVWYSSAVSDEDLATLEDLADRVRNDGDRRKFIVSSWDDSYGAFPEGKTIALAHWSRDAGHRQLCGQVSGEVVDQFMTQFPFSDAPEPNAA